GCGLWIVDCGLWISSIERPNYQHFTVDIANKEQVQAMFIAIYQPFQYIHMLISHARRV
ncbi:MAG: hypothetical protein ACI9C4_001464, partial [Paraglaciecola sp.]